MPYNGTLEKDVEQAKGLLARGRLRERDLPASIPREMAQIFIERSGTILATDTYSAFKLLESLVEEVERLQRELATSELARREQFHTLRVIRETADLATGTDRSKGDERRSGALGAVQLLVERFNARKET